MFVASEQEVSFHCLNSLCLNVNLLSESPPTWLGSHAKVISTSPSCLIGPEEKITFCGGDEPNLGRLFLSGHLYFSRPFNTDGDQGRCECGGVGV